MTSAAARSGATVLVLALLLAITAAAAPASGGEPTYGVAAAWGKPGAGLPGEPEAHRPDDLAVGPTGDVFVLDGDDAANRVLQVSPTGDLVRILGVGGTGPGQLQEPVAIEVGADGTLYVLDSGDPRVHRFAADGTQLPSWGAWGTDPGLMADPKDMAMGPDGDLWVVDVSEGADVGRVQRFEPDGTFVSTFGTLGPGEDQIARGIWGIDVDAGGDVWLGGGGIRRFSPTGELLASFAGAGGADLVVADRVYTAGARDELRSYPLTGGDAQILDISGIVASLAGGNDDDLWVGLVSLEGSPLVTHHALDGTLLGSWGTHGRGDPDEPRLDDAIDVAFTPTGEVAVLEQGTRRIQRFTASGAVAGVVPLGPVGAGSAQPRALAVDGEGRLFVAFGGEVHRFGPDGSPQGAVVTGLAGTDGITDISVGDGTLFVLHHSQVRSYDLDGVPGPSTEVPTAWPGWKALTAVGDDEVLLARQGVVSRYAVGGAVVDTWDGVEQVFFRDVAVGPEGDVYSIDAYRPARHTLDGAYVAAWGDGEAGTGHLRAVDVAPDGRVVVLAYYRVTLYAPDQPPPTATFPDVGLAHPFFDEIEWLTAEGITGGYGDGTFKPAAAISRQAMSAFLYRFAGEPPFTAPATPTFADVAAHHPFYDEIEWMAHQGISTGQHGRYRPAAPVTRQAMSAFLYRFAGEPPFTAPATPTFADVAAHHPFHDEIEWMAHVELSTGHPDGTYRPLEPVSRQAMAAFLYRFAGQPA